MSGLREATRDLHHRAEQHPIGAAMAAGTIGAQAWADWLGALLVVHAAIDPHVPPACRRVDQLLADVVGGAPLAPRWSVAAASYANSLSAIDGAFYVFTGAHLMGGALIEKLVRDRLPCEHLRWADRKASIGGWSYLREITDPAVEQQARDAFAAVLAIMDEVLQRQESRHVAG